MTTLRLPKSAELATEDRQIVEGIAKRLGTPPDQMSPIWRAQFRESAKLWGVPSSPRVASRRCWKSDGIALAVGHILCGQ
jgi:hypothetical protein